MEGIIFVIALVMLAVDYFAAKKFEEIAIMKGHNDKSYFWYSFLLGPIGFAMVIALPDRNQKTEEVPAKDTFDNNALPEL